MKALTIEGIGKVALMEAPDPVAGAGEAVVGLRAAALNHRHDVHAADTDQRITRQDDQFGRGAIGDV